MRTLELQLVVDTLHDNMIGVIPSSYSLCRMYDSRSVRFEVTSGDDSIFLEDYDIYIRMISGNLDEGKALIIPDNNGKYYYEVSAVYTSKSKLQAQLILQNNNNDEIRTNIVTFELYNSLPLDVEFYQNLSYLNRLVCDKRIALAVDPDCDELIIYDDLDNILCSIDIEDYLTKGGDEEE